MKLTSSYLACFAVLAVFSHADAQDFKKSPRVAESGELKISNALGYAPFQYADESGKPAGFNIELAQAVADKLGVKLDIAIVPFANQLPSLASGREDAAWATFSVTPERVAQVDFVTFLNAASVLITTPQNLSRFQTKADLCGASIALQTGAAADFALDALSKDCKAEGKPEIKKQIFPDQQSAIQSLAIKRVDGVFDDSTAAAYLETTSGGKFVIAPGAYSPTPLGIAVAKGDKDTAQMIQSVFQSLMDDGSYKKLVEKYHLSSSAQTRSEIITH